MEEFSKTGHLITIKHIRHTSLSLTCSGLYVKQDSG